MTRIATEFVHFLVLIAALVRFVVIPMLRQRFGLSVSAAHLGSSLRQFLDRSGLIYRKLGQYLAMRNDLLPPSICAQLDLLFENVTPMPFAEVLRLLKSELARPLEECFAWFDPEPLGSASVAQVHRAKSLDGEDLAVKVQRAGIQKEFAADVRIFRRIASLCDLFRLTGSLAVREFFDEFVQFTERELDFELEGRSAERLRRTISSHGHVPAVRWDLTTRRLLTMEYIEGETFLTICKLGEAGRSREVSRMLPGVDLHKAVSNLADECFHQLFTTGFFHGDPHPGNVILRKDASFVFLDCGITGDLSPDHRRDFRGYVENLAMGRFAESAAYYTRLCELTERTDMDAWMYDVTAALAAWYSNLRDPHSSIELRHMGHLQSEIAFAMRRNNVLARANQILVWRALVLLDTTTMRLPIRFDVLHAMVSFFRREKAHLGKILLPLSVCPEDLPALARDLLASTRSLLNPTCRAGPLTVLRSVTVRRNSTQRSANRLVCALASVACATIAANTGGGTVGSLGVIASTLLLLLAIRR